MIHLDTVIVLDVIVTQCNCHSLLAQTAAAADLLHFV